MFRSYGQTTRVQWSHGVEGRFYFGEGDTNVHDIVNDMG